MSQFWGAHQRSFKQLCMAIKVGAVVRIAQRARAEGKCVVIGLQTTGEARLVEAIADAGEACLEEVKPHALWAATLFPGCSPVFSRLQPCASEVAAFGDSRR